LSLFFVLAGVSIGSAQSNVYNVQIVSFPSTVRPATKAIEPTPSSVPAGQYFMACLLVAAGVGFAAVSKRRLGAVRWLFRPGLWLMVEDLDMAEIQHHTC
jgi:hypothetical protein